jgi:hypothetical protein
MSILTEKLRTLVQTLEPVGVHYVNVYHDEWCQVFLGGACNCFPTVTASDSPPPAKWSEDFKRRCRERRKAKGKAARQ